MYATNGFGLSVYHEPGTPQNPIVPEPLPPPTLHTASSGWWGQQSPTVRYAIMGVGAFAILGVLGVALKKK